MRLAFWPSRRRAAVAALTPLAAAFVVLSACATAVHAAPPLLGAARRYGNTINTRFATVSNGPQNAVIVDVPARADRAAVQAAVRRSVRADWAARARAAAPMIARLQKRGLLKANTAIPVSTLVMVRQDGKLVQPPVTRGLTRQTGNRLTFTFSGFDNPNDQQIVQNQIALFYPRIEAVYGQPSWSGNVEVVNVGYFGNGNSKNTDVRRLALGTYDVANRQILLPLYQEDEPYPNRGRAVLLTLLHAFHGPATFQYDAWEQGFARAAAAVISRDILELASAASANGVFSLLSLYDVLNQPNLGNSKFFPESVADLPLIDESGAGFGIGKMFYPRLGMSGAAWLKVYTENQNFFRQFNETYYAQFAGNNAVAGNVPALVAIAQAFAPTVEGQAFRDWYQQQYVLDTSVTVGRKLYAFVLPEEPHPGPLGLEQSPAVTLEYFQTFSGGDEKFLPEGNATAQAYASYFDASNSQTFYGGESEQQPIQKGEGFFTLFATPQDDLSDATRLTMDFHVGTETARAYVPIGARGNFQVMVLGATNDASGREGRFRVASQTIVGGQQLRSGEGALRGATGGVTLETGPNELAKTLITILDANGNTVATRQVNTGDGSYVAVVRLNGTNGNENATGVVTLTHTYAPGLQLASFPVRPLTTDIAGGLGLVDPSRPFVLSFYDPAARNYQNYAPGLLTAPPLSPGRGYFFKTSADSGPSTVTITGYAPARDTDFSVSLPFGWNLIGVPFGRDTDRVPVAGLGVQYLLDGFKAFEDAVAANQVADTLYGWDTTTQQYVPLNAAAGDLSPWQGYWVRVLVPSGVALAFPGPEGANRGRSIVQTKSRASGTKPSVPGRPDWAVRLRAVGPTGAGPAVTATFGVAPGASAGFDNHWDRENPPALAPGLTLGFAHPDWGNAAGLYRADFRDAASAVTRAASPSGAKSSAWDLGVSSPVDGRVTLSWDGMNLGNNAAGRNTRLVLVDTATGTRTYLRDRSSYSFEAKAGQVRSFRLEAAPQRTLAFAVRDIVFARAGGRSAGASGATTRSVSFTLSDDAADVTVELQTLAGKTVRRAASGRAVAGGRQTVRLVGMGEGSGRAEGDGPSLVSGPYLVRITARSPDGARAVATRPVLILE